MQQSNLLKKIAIVDDAPGCMKMERGRLNEETVREHVQCFEKASGLLDYLRGLKKDRLMHEFPDYILIDIRLPDMEAAAFLDSFEKIIGKMETPEVFILSSSGNKKNRDLAMQYPFVSAYLEKPVPPDLVEVLIAGRSVDDSPH